MFAATGPYLGLRQILFEYILVLSIIEATSRLHYTKLLAFLNSKNHSVKFEKNICDSTLSNPLYIIALLNGSTDKRSGITQLCHYETERNGSLTHFLCNFLMGLLSGWLEGGTM